MTGASSRRFPPACQFDETAPKTHLSHAATRFACHPIQAMTNYAYAVLESQIRIETARIGLDQATGFLHQTMADRPALILDLLEPLRPVIDGIILRFIQSQMGRTAPRGISVP